MNENKELDNDVREAHFCSVWDGGIKVETECKVNIKTREVFDIEQSGIDADRHLS